MNVEKLIGMLQACNPNDYVVMASDGEGNSYSPIDDISTIFTFVADEPYVGEVHLRELTPELENAGFGEEDVYDGDDGLPCVVLWPRN